MEVWGGNQATERSFSTLGLESWVYSRPYQLAEAGGDVYFASSCATGRITRLLVADVSGHGTAVSGVANRLRALMRRHVNHIEQTQFISQMNAEFKELAHIGGFATAVAATYLAPGRQLTITNAGHPPPLLYRASERCWKVLDQDGAANASAPVSFSGPADLPLGLLEEMSYGQQQEVLNRDDLVLLYTDSLIEARSSSGELLKVDGLLQLVRQLDARQPERLIPALLQAIASLHAQNLTDDDVTVLLFRAVGGSGAVPFRQRWEAPFRFLWGCTKALCTGQALPLPEFTWANLGGSLFDRRDTSQESPD